MIRPLGPASVPWYTCALLAATACVDRPIATVDPTQTREVRTEFLVEANRNVDLLFVVDNSRSMEAEQVSLATNFVRMIDALESFDAGLPNVHIGVISTDTGTGPYAVAGCTSAGDAGRLQATPRQTGCPPPGPDPFLIDVQPEGDGPRQRNYTGSLSDAFSCIARLGTAGCGFEQPLESVKLALDGSNPQNARFLRDNALLAIVFITDEDDCSAADPVLYDRARTDLGAHTSYRCFEYGVVCDPDAPRELGIKQGCVPRQDSPYLREVRQYVDFVKSLKPSDSLIMTFGIVGNVGPVEVELDSNGDLDLASSCDASAPGKAVPPIRIKAFMDAFPTSELIPICGEDLSAALQYIGEVVGRENRSCIVGELADRDLDTPGLQPDCVVTEVTAPNTTDEREVTVPRCDDSAAPERSSVLPCYTMTEEPDLCPQTATHLNVVIHHDPGDVVPPDSIARVRCVGR